MKKKPFPWRVFRRAFFAQACLTALGLGLAHFLLQGAWFMITFAAWSVLCTAWALRAASKGAYSEWSALESDIDHIERDLATQNQILSMEQVQLETILAAISDAILAVDREGVPLFYNSRVGVLLGAESLRHGKLWELIREPEVLGAYRLALHHGKMANANFALERDGRRRYFSLSVSPLRASDGAVYGAVGIYHDVTDLKSAEQMRIDFVANATHELRTPLTSIRGYAETLSLDIAEGRPMEPDFVRAIHRNTDRLMNLMNDLLDLSSLESGDVLRREPLSTIELTNKCLRGLQSRFDAKGQMVQMHIPAKTVNADPNRLDQVVVNLLDNANKYAPEGGKIVVEWTTERADTVLKVWNNGPGIPFEHQARLFERFYRIDKARSREQGGTGLGLAIVKHIVQRHGGAVTVESRPGAGATFICRFPSVVRQESEQVGYDERAVVLPEVDAARATFDAAGRQHL